MSDSARLWFDSLSIKDFNEEVITLVGRAWVALKRTIKPTDWEDHITRILVKWVKKTLRKEQATWGVHSQAETFHHTLSGSSTRSGRSDITISICYRDIIYECKRLNTLKNKRGRASLATEYVTEGLSRFLSRQYAAEEDIGGMLGYVMDGDVKFAHTQICSSIMTNAKPKGIKDPDESPPQPDMYRFRTEHTRQGTSPITLYHVLLPV